MKAPQPAPTGQPYVYEEYEVILAMTKMSHDMVSYDTIVVFQCISFVLGLPIIVFGIATNAISIACFLKQGFKDSVNISLLGLAISDMMCLVPVIWTKICYVPAFIQLDLPFDPMGVQYLTGAWIHVLFARMTSWITAFITVERCLCITMPLKVKSMFTHTLVTAIIVGIYCVLTISAVPVFYVKRLGIRFSPAKNKSIYGLIFTEGQESIEAINFAVNNVFVQFSAFFVIVVGTVILVVELRRKALWRVKSAPLQQVNGSSKRDQKVVKMVVAMSLLYIACLTPMVIINIAMIVEPRFAIAGDYNNLFTVVNSIGFSCESINPAVNIFIYYSMSSKYRITLQRIILSRCLCFLTNK